MEYVVLALVLLGRADRRRPSGWSCPGCAAGAEPPPPPAPTGDADARATPPADAGRPAAGVATAPPVEPAEPPPVLGAAASRRPSRPPGGWSGCAPGCPARRTCFGKGLLGLLVPRPPRRRRLGGDRGQPDHRRRRRRGHPRDRRPAPRAGPGARHPHRRRAARAARRRAGRRARPEPGPHACGPRRTTAARRCCWWSASTAPARPPPAARSPGCWSPTAARVLLGAADTFRAAAADQLATWGGRVGAEVVRGPEGADPASVAFDAVKRGIDTGVDTVLIDTAGRLQNKVGLMDELGKVKRVVEKHGPVDETLLDPGRHHRAERPGAGPGLHRGGRRHRRGAHQARRHRQGRHRHRRAAQARHPGEAGRPRRGPGRPGAVRARRSSSTRCLARDA